MAYEITTNPLLSQPLNGTEKRKEKGKKNKIKCDEAKEQRIHKLWTCARMSHFLSSNMTTKFSLISPKHTQKAYGKTFLHILAHTYIHMDAHTQTNTNTMSMHRHRVSTTQTITNIRDCHISTTICPTLRPLYF